MIFQTICKNEIVVKLSSVIFLCVFLLLVTTSNLIFGNKQQHLNQKELNFTNLELKITSVKSEFVPIEPIPIKLSVHNPTSTFIETHTGLEFLWRYVDIFIRHEEVNEFKKIDSPSLAIGYGRPGIKRLEPGGSFEAQELLSFNLDKYFSKSGVYYLKASFYSRERAEIVSNILTINISEPDGINREAFQFIKSKTRPSLFYDADDLYSDERTQSVLKEFVSVYADSVYGVYAIYRLGNFYFYKKDYVNAKTQFERLEKKPNFIYAEEVKKRLVDIENKLKGQ